MRLFVPVIYLHQMDCTSKQVKMSALQDPLTAMPAKSTERPFCTWLSQRTKLSTFSSPSLSHFSGLSSRTLSPVLSNNFTGISSKRPLRPLITSLKASLSPSSTRKSLTKIGTSTVSSLARLSLSVKQRPGLPESNSGQRLNAPSSSSCVTKNSTR